MLGSVSVDLAVSVEETYTFDTVPEVAESEKLAEDDKTPSFVFINIIKVLVCLGIIAVILVIVFVARIFLKNYQFPGRSRRSWARDRRRSHSFHPSHRRDNISTGSSFQMHRKEQIRQAKRRQKARRSRKI